MSSREIAQLCNKDHRHVLRDIDDLKQHTKYEDRPKLGSQIILLITAKATANFY